jgi:L-glyceraldehyde 3-phosphate reductase
MFDRWVENGLLNVLEQNGGGCIAFSPLAQGLLTNRYLGGIPNDSRASKSHGFLKADMVTPDKIQRIEKLNQIAEKRGQTLAQMAVAWLLKDQRLTSVLIGVSKVQQVDDCAAAVKNLNFTTSELQQIEEILK